MIATEKHALTSQFIDYASKTTIGE